MTEVADSGAAGVSEDTEQSARRLSLDSWHRNRGASMTTHLGFSMPRDYGDLGVELEALRTEAVWVDRSCCGRLEMLGEDRQRFLNGLCTANTLELASGSSVYGFITDAKGKVMADLTVIAHPDRLWLVLPAGLTRTIRQHLLRFVVADRVEILPLDELLPLTLVGPSAGAKLMAAGADSLPEIGGHREVSLLHSCIQLVRHRWQKLDAFTLWVPASIAAMVADDLVDDLGVRVAGLGATERLRIEEGWPEFGIDYGPGNLPQETGLESAVDYQKGCYLGQEVIARLHYRGQAARSIHSVSLEAAPGSTDEAAPRAGQQLLLEGRPCGSLTSVAHSEGLGGWIGLAMLHRRVEAGDWMSLEHGGRARIKAGVSVDEREYGRTARYERPTPGD